MVKKPPPPKDIHSKGSFFFSSLSLSLFLSLSFLFFFSLFLSHKPKKNLEKDQPQKRRWSEDLLLVERSRAESEVVLWIKKVIDLSVELYPHPQNRSLLENLTVVSV